MSLRAQNSSIEKLAFSLVGRCGLLLVLINAHPNFDERPSTSTGEARSRYLIGTKWDLIAVAGFAPDAVDRRRLQVGRKMLDGALRGLSRWQAQLDHQPACFGDGMIIVLC